MANNVTLPGTGEVVETVDVGGAMRQVVQVANLPATQAVSAAALPLPAGASTETTAAALLVAAQAIKTAAETLAGRTLDTSAIAGTVTANTGLAQPLTDAQLRATPIAVSSSVAYAEDTQHVTGSMGNLMLAIRSDSDSATADNGDYTILKMDEEGRLKVASKPASYAPTVGNVTTAASTVFVNTTRFSNLMIHCKGTFAGVNVTFEGSLDSTNGTDGTWFGVQAIRSNANTIETTTGVLGAAPAYAWELSVNALTFFRVRATAWTSGTQVWTMIPGTYATEPIPGAQISGTQPVSGTVTATVTGGTVVGVAPTTTNAILSSAATTNGTVAKASAGTIYGLTVSNTGAAAAFVKLHNSTTITVGTTAVALTVPVPAGGVVSLAWGTQGMRYATGICYSITNLAADTDTTAVALNQVKVNLSYI